MRIANINDPSKYMHIGDDYGSDIVGANNAGWKSVMITNGFYPMITSTPPTVQVSSMEELYYYFKSLLN